MHQRTMRGCLKPRPGSPYVVGEFTTARCPKRSVLDNPWIGGVWAAQELITLEHSNKMHDATSVIKSADAWRQRQEMEEIRKKSSSRG